MTSYALIEPLLSSNPSLQQITFTIKTLNTYSRLYFGACDKEATLTKFRYTIGVGGKSYLISTDGTKVSDHI